MSDTRNHATRRRQEKQEVLRDYMAERNQARYIFDNIDKMEKEGGDLSAQELTALKYATECRIKLTGKYLPDLKQTEIIGDEDSPLSLVHDHTVEFVGIPNL